MNKKEIDTRKEEIKMSEMDILIFVIVIFFSLAMIGWGTYLLIRNTQSNDFTWGCVFVAIGALILMLYAVFG